MKEFSPYHSFHFFPSYGICYQCCQPVFSFLVAPCIMILSLGNNPFRHSLVEKALGLVGVVVIVILPAVIEFDWAFLDTTRSEQNSFTSSIRVLFDIVVIFIGVVLLLLKLFTIVRFMIPDKILSRSSTLTSLLRGSSVKSEFSMKQATIFKVHQMVANAFELHQDNTSPMNDDDNNELSDARGLLNFTKVTEKKEDCGGFCWAWQMFLSGKSLSQEGVW